MNKEVLMDKRMSMMLRVEDALGRMKSEAIHQYFFVHVFLLKSFHQIKHDRTHYQHEHGGQY